MKLKKKENISEQSISLVSMCLMFLACVVIGITCQPHPVCEVTLTHRASADKFRPEHTLYIFKVSIPRRAFPSDYTQNGSVVHMTNYSVNRTMSSRIDCPWRSQRKSPVKSTDFSTRYYPLIQ